MVYQCSTEMAETSFRHIGSELLDLLSVVLIAQLNAHCIHDDHVMSSSSKCDEHSVPDTYRSSSTNENRDVTVKSVTRIVSSFARVQPAITVIARHSRLITLLEAIVECSKSTISFESQHNALWILANVACDKSNSLFIVTANKRLLYTLSNVICNAESIVQQFHARSSVANCGRVLQLQRTSLRCIFNLTFVEKVADQIILRCNTLLTALCRIIILQTEMFSRSAYIHEQVIRAKRYASGILYNLSNSGEDKKHLLCRFQNGLLMRSLRDAADCGDEIVERKATQTIANLVIFDRAHVISPLILGTGS